MYNLPGSGRIVAASLLIAFSILALNPACAKEPGSQKSPSPASARQAAPQSASSTVALAPENAPALAKPTADVKVDVYLFHGTYRCYSCNLMEQLTVEAIDEQLANEKKNGAVAFHHINVEEDQHRHFIQDYKLAAISIILSQKSGGKEKRWKNLDQVWTLLRDRQRFKDYVVKELQNFLKG